jgi:NADH dehydrogenase
MGVSVREITASDVLLSDGTRLEASVVVWAGGLQAAALSHSLGIELGHGSRVDVAPDLTLPGYSGIYVLGDFANMTDADGQRLPQLASVAQQAGRHCARNILADLAGVARTPFVYVDRGIMAMVGRNAAVAELGTKRWPITGVPAFLAWLAVHAMLMTSLRARIATLFTWASNFFGNVHINPILDQPTAESASERARLPVAR